MGAPKRWWTPEVKGKIWHFGMKLIKIAEKEELTDLVQSYCSDICQTRKGYWERKWKYTDVKPEIQISLYIFLYLSLPLFIPLFSPSPFFSSTCALLSSSLGGVCTLNTQWTELEKMRVQGWRRLREKEINRIILLSERHECGKEDRERDSWGEDSYMMNGHRKTAGSFGLICKK